MLGTAIAAPLPILFVFALGYAAGRAKQFNAAQSLGASRPAGGTGGRGQHRDHLQRAASLMEGIYK